MSNREYVAYRIRFSDLDEDPKQEALKNLLRASDTETAILADIFMVPNTWQYTAEILRGAYLRVHDCGALFCAWKTLPGANSRPSLHHSDGAQYHVDGPFVHTALFGKISDRTWIQLEGHSLWSPFHYTDWIKYHITHENQGPYGSSPYRESRPLEFLPSVDD